MIIWDWSLKSLVALLLLPILIFGGLLIEALIEPQGRILINGQVAESGVIEITDNNGTIQITVEGE